jgi:hypothetical protein
MGPGFSPSILSIKCASTTYMNPFDMLRCEINAFMNYAPPFKHSATRDFCVQQLDKVKETGNMPRVIRNDFFLADNSGDTGKYICCYF